MEQGIQKSSTQRLVDSSLYLDRSYMKSNQGEEIH